MQSSHVLARALWPALVLAVLVFVVVDFLRYPVLGAESQADVAPRAHVTLMLLAVEATGQSAAAVHDIAGSFVLAGRPATVQLLPGSSSQALTDFLDHRQPANRLLVASSETLADLAQERTSALPGDEPLRAARAQRLLAHAVPVGVLGGEPLAIGVLPAAHVRDVAQLLAQVRRSAQAHVFAIANDNWDTDNLAALVRNAGGEGLVPYRVFPSSQDAALSLVAGSADVVLAPREALLGEVRAGRLRTLAWPRDELAPSAWVALLAAPGTSHTAVLTLRRQLRELAGAGVWRELQGGVRRQPLEQFSGQGLRGFLSAQMAQTAVLEQVAQRVERNR